MRRRYFAGPPSPHYDFPHQPRPPGGFTRPMVTCAACGMERPRFHWEMLGYCPVCLLDACPDLVPGFACPKAS